MEITTEEINELISKGLNNSYSYKEYRELVSNLLKEGKSTGPNQSEDLTKYSFLNDKRMKRLDKTIMIEERVKSVFQDMETDVTWLVITEGWCGDAAHILPIVYKLSELNEGISLKIVLRDENDELMNHFLTNGGKSIPKLIVFDNKKKEVTNTWGPRPSVATEMVRAYKEANGSVDAEFKQQLQVWYNKDKGRNIANDLMELL